MPCARKLVFQPRQRTGFQSVSTCARVLVCAPVGSVGMEDEGKKDNRRRHETNTRHKERQTEQLEVLFLGSDATPTRSRPIYFPSSGIRERGNMMSEDVAACGQPNANTKTRAEMRAGGWRRGEHEDDEKVGAQRPSTTTRRPNGGGARPNASNGQWEDEGMLQKDECER